MDKRYFSDIVVEWYEIHKRTLPWRETRDPYRIWLSEIILQQTRVNQGLPYYLSFIEKFPSVDALAAAPEQHVLRLWQGLGYYSRARNLHKCAQELVQNHQSMFPTTFRSLRKLPGIGDYTAAAIASFAFRESVAVVDGNVFRVISRLFGLNSDINSQEGKKQFVALANDLINKERPDIHNQALMEFGALHCTPKNPRCPDCIFIDSCFAASQKMQHLLPVKAKSKAPRKRYFYYLVIRKGKSLLMRQRTGKDIWEGLYDFYLIERKRSETLSKIIHHLNESTCSNIKQEKATISPPYKHILTHQIIFSRFIVVEGESGFGVSQRSLKFYSAKKIAALPKPVLISRFLADHKFL